MYKIAGRTVRPIRLNFKGHIIISDPYYLMNWGKLEKVFPPEKTDYETVEEYKKAIHQYRTIYDEWYRCREGRALKELGYYSCAVEKGFRIGSIHEFFDWEGNKIGEIDLPSGQIGIFYYDDIIENNSTYRVKNCFELEKGSIQIKYENVLVHDDINDKEIMSKTMMNKGMNMFFTKEKVIEESYNQKISI